MLLQCQWPWLLPGTATVHLPVLLNTAIMQTPLAAITPTTLTLVTIRITPHPTIIPYMLAAMETANLCHILICAMVL